MENSYRQQIFELIDEDYQKFSSKLIPTIDNVLGVRLPALRKIAKEIAKSDWRTYLETAESEYFEEVMLQGMVLGYVKADIEEILSYITAFVPKIDNWSVCDSFCIGLKFTKVNQERVWAYLQPYLTSEKEYDIRFGVVMLLNFYIDDAYIDKVLHSLDCIKHDGYYVKMAVAWAISICYVKLPEPTTIYLNENALDDFTYNKALQKIIESYRVDEETKQRIRNMKRK
ncbi:DNA alkylation repair protein [Sporosarcina soli]|uniref:DNA alkylation repair protein n=1 Tax=Sporosarcina soli TaxID=334736 RepID=A0ABW0TJJ7_9BACL